jgi:methanogenic corrinoid protein MtbC1
MENIRQQAAQKLRARQHELAEEIVSRQYASQSESWKTFGGAGWDYSIRDAGYHLTYLSEALNAGNPVLFIEYLAWVKVLFAGLKFKPDVLPVTIHFTREVLAETLDVGQKEVALEYIDMALQAYEQAPIALESFLDQGDHLGNLSRRFIAMLLSADRHGASQLILDAVQRGDSIKDIYLFVFQTSQREIGRLWQTNQISVAQEHFCTAATQLIMSQLYPFIFSSERNGRSMVVTCVGGELHELGARMVADFFEMEGWDTYFLGANTPAVAIIRALEERNADLLAISATMTFHIEKVTQLISEIRKSGLEKMPKILVGGYPFNIAPNLWQVVGADGYASDARQAVETAGILVA